MELVSSERSHTQSLVLCSNIEHSKRFDDQMEWGKRNMGYGMINLRQRL